MSNRPPNVAVPRRAATTAATRRQSALVFAALGDETRLGLVSRLSSGGPMSIVRLSEGAAVTRQAVTKHLHLLSGARLVRSARRGRERVLQLAPERLQDARRALDRISADWDVALDWLKMFVER
jgi:DNA-binding transcriptional ArsR family regulator